MSKTPRCNELINKHGFSTTRNGDKAVLVSDYRFSEDAFALARRLETELADRDRQLAEAKAEIERLKSEHEDSLCRAKDNAVSLSGTVTKYAGELLARDKLIEQMRAIFIEMLAKSRVEVWAWESKIRAALAAERG